MEPPLIIRASKATLIIFLVIFCPFLLMSVALIWAGTQIMTGLVLGGVYLFLVYWISAPRLELSPQRLVYRSVFRREEIDLTRISRVSLTARPAPTLVFHGNERGEKPPAFIIKPFSKNGIIALFQHIRSANPSISLDAPSRDMSEGDFRAVTRETIAAANLLRIAFVVAATTVGGAMIRLLLSRNWN